MRILVLSVSAGAGHVRAAQSLCATAEATMPGLQLQHLDLMEIVPKAFRKLYAESYIKLVEHAPLLWAYLYQRSDKRESRSITDRLRRRAERLNTRKLDAEIRRAKPDAIICTHFLPAELLSRRIGKGQATPPVWVQVTDFDVHRLWLQSNVSGYFVANQEVGARLAARGVDPACIHVTGIAIMPQFSQAPTRAVAAAELGLDPAKFTVLMMSGGAGVGGIDELVEVAANLPRELQVVALAGRNEALLARLQEIAARHPGRIVPLGFTRTIERAMAAADLAVTKPGGLTSSECLAMQLPMIVVSPIPGQEERNCDYLLETGSAVKAVDTASFAYKLQRLADSPALLQRMREQQGAVRTPQAAQRILEVVAGR